MPDPSIAQLAKRLVEALGEDRVLSAESDLFVYESDAFTIAKSCPDLAVFPETSEEVAAVVTLCNEFEVPFLPRGAGTSLAGGAIAVGGGVLIVLTRMREILEINLRDRYAVVEPGVVNASLAKALKGTQFHYAPDPSSQGACTIGGNIATNAGGPHTLKYGVTTNHILGVEAVMPNGELVQFGGPVEDPTGLDIVHTLVGSEGTLGIITKAWVRLTPNPQAYRTLLVIFDSLDDTTQTISDIIGAGIIPAALELMDQGILVAVEEAFGFGFPLDAKAILIIEIDGLEAGLDALRDRIETLCKKNNAREIRLAHSEEERNKLWMCRKKAFGAIGRLSAGYCTQDGVVPRTKLPHLLRRIQEISAKYDIRIVNVFHAGDGNVHPILLFNPQEDDELKRTLLASEEVLRECLACGGSVTGEHGVGIEKINLLKEMYTGNDLEVMKRLKKAINPKGLLSPGKMLPTSGACGMEQLLPGSGSAEQLLPDNAEQSLPKDAERIHPGRQAAL